MKHVIDEELAKRLCSVLNELVDGKILLVEDENKYDDNAFKIALDHDAPYIAQSSKRGQLLTSDGIQRKAAEEIKLKVIFVP